ncbi:pyruvate kinase alpha/beta domain-containing protein, partial [Mycoplasma sp. M5725]
NIHTMEDYTAAHPGEREQIANIINHAAKSGEYKFIIVLSRTGELLKTVSKYRPNSQVIGLIKDESLIYSFGLYFGVFISMDSSKLFDLVKQDKTQAFKTLTPYQPTKGDKFLVVENDNITKFTY